MTLQPRWLGRVAYPAAHELMEQALEDRIAGRIPDTLLLLEHDPVYTLGRRKGSADNVLDPRGVPVIPVERGGDVTFHGPGQLVGYPILALPEGKQDLIAYLRGLEGALIALLARYGVRGERDARNAGVWVEGRKMAALGVACRRWVTWHGFAVNLDVDLDYYRRINPCGMGSSLVTRLADHAPSPPMLEELRDAAIEEVGAWWAGWLAAE